MVLEYRGLSEEQIKELENYAPQDLAKAGLIIIAAFENGSLSQHETFQQLFNLLLAISEL